ncbi:MAG TPA: G1 family glutamic endopeptidase [Ktedonobacterales bacterium]|nr:G1 family glutamic endopeptidase [Ktedonobacterales bacterium]
MVAPLRVRRIGLLLVGLLTAVALSVAPYLRPVSAQGLTHPQHATASTQHATSNLGQPQSHAPFPQGRRRNSHRQPLSGNEGTQYNPIFAGYEAVDWFAYKEIAATWTVPLVYDVGLLPAATSQWIGFDGNSLEQPGCDYSPLVQTGTDSDVNIRGQVSYYGWYEVNEPEYDANCHIIGDHDLINNYFQGVTINANDQINASISLSGNTFYFAFDDVTQKYDRVVSYTWSTSYTYKEYSAQFVIERPTDPNTNQIYNLAVFETTSFTGCDLKWVSGQWHPINYGSYFDDWMTRNGNPTDPILAFADTSTFTGSSFTIDFLRGS